MEFNVMTRTHIGQFTLVHVAKCHSTISQIMLSYFPYDWFQDNSMCIDRRQSTQLCSYQMENVLKEHPPLQAIESLNILLTLMAQWLSGSAETVPPYYLINTRRCMYGLVAYGSTSLSTTSKYKAAGVRVYGSSAQNSWISVYYSIVNVCRMNVYTET